MASSAATASSATAQPTSRNNARGDTARAVHLLQRASFGGRPADVAAVLAVGREAWLEQQLHPRRIDDSALQQRLARFPTATMSVAELFTAVPPPRLRRQQVQARGDSTSTTARRVAAAQRPGRIDIELVGAKLLRAVASERQLEEVMTDFWFNHFNVYLRKGPLRWLVADYERSAIRPHVFGRFEDMLIATARHPAMLLYLDNARSVAPDTLRAGVQRRQPILQRWLTLSPEQRAAAIRSGRITPAQANRLERLATMPRRTAGMNENYARELLELHTLGVDGGYSQQDVLEVARAFTGWSVDELGQTSNGAAPRFVFRERLHDRGAKTVLGHALPAGRGQEDGLEVLRLLARHPATARRIATKLAERFVADAPPPALVDHLAEVFLRTEGDLRAVTRALFSAEEFYHPAHYRAKVKTPFELVASALRVSGAEVNVSPSLLQTLREFGHVPYFAAAPTGYPAASEEWTSSGAMLSRMNFALALAEGGLRGTRPDLAMLLTPRPETPEALARRTAESVLPGAPSEPLQSVVAADLRAHGGEPSRALAARALGLMLGSPDFQRR